MAAASFFAKKKPLDCARGDKQKRYSGQQETAPKKITLSYRFQPIRLANE
jgi:hypothetical protein